MEPGDHGAIGHVNEAFHDAYGDARKVAELDAPVFVLLPETLVVHHRGVRRELPARPPAFHVIKGVTHAPVALFALCERGAGARDFAGLVERVQRGRAQLAAEGEVEGRGELEAVLRATEELAHALAEGRASADAHEAFAAQLGPRLLSLAALATRLQLDALHEAVERALASFDARERRQLEVVVTGDHQARARSLALQYFQKRFGEPPEREARVCYAEAVDDEAGALALIGTRRLDRALARAFFGNEKRLQRDVLGDAAKALLDRQTYEPIDG